MAKKKKSGVFGCVGLNKGCQEISAWTDVLLENYGEGMHGDDQEEAQAKADIFSALYGMDERKAEPGELAGETAQYLDSLQAQTEWEELSELAASKPWICASVSEEIYRKIREEQEQNCDGDGEGDQPKGSGISVSDLLEDAKAEAEEHESAMRACGAEQGSPRNMVQDIKGLSDSLAKNKQLMKLTKLAGHFAGVGSGKARRRRAGGSWETVGIERGGLDEIARALPEELLGLVMPELEPAMYKALTEESVLVEEVIGTTPQTKGPVVCVVDESGSMEGDRIFFARAVALAMFMRCRKERRPFAVVLFDYKTRRWEYPKPHTVQLNPSSAESGFGLEWLETFSGGGTNIDRALDDAHKFIKSSKGAMRKADIVLVTDGECEGWDHRLKELKDDGVSVFGVGIAMGRSWKQAEQMAGSVVFSDMDLQDGGAKVASKMEGLAV